MLSVRQGVNFPVIILNLSEDSHFLSLKVRLETFDDTLGKVVVSLLISFVNNCEE